MAKTYAIKDAVYSKENPGIFSFMSPMEAIATHRPSITNPVIIMVISLLFMMVEKLQYQDNSLPRQTSKQ